MADVTNFTDIMNMLGHERELITVNQRKPHIL